MLLRRWKHMKRLHDPLLNESDELLGPPHSWVKSLRRAGAWTTGSMFAKGSVSPLGRIAHTAAAFGGSVPTFAPVIVSAPPPFSASSCRVYRRLA